MKNTNNKNILSLGIFLFLAAGISFSLQAKEIYFPNAKVSFWVPNEWTRNIDGEAISVAEPNGDVLLVISAIETNDLNSVINNLDAELSRTIDNVSIDEEASETSLNNMPAVVIEASGQVDGQDVEIGVIIAITPAEKVLLAVGIIDASKTDQHEATLERVFGGIKGTR